MESFGHLFDPDKVAAGLLLAMTYGKTIHPFMCLHSAPPPCRSLRLNVR